MSTSDALDRLSGRDPAMSNSLQPASPVFSAERAVIGAILADNALYHEAAAHLSEKSFLDPGCAAAWRGIEEILTGMVEGVARAEAMTVVVRRGVQSKVSMSRLNEYAIVADTDPGVFSGRVRVVRDSFTGRQLASNIERAKQVAGDVSLDVDQRAARIDAIMEATEVRAASAAGIGDLAEQAITEIVDVIESGGSVRGMDTGSVQLDAMTAGWHGTQMIVIAGRPAMGKTSFAFKSALTAARNGKHVMAVSLEMSGTELAKRIVSMVSGVDGQRIKFGALDADEWDAVGRALEEIKTLPIAIVDLPRANIRSISAEARRRRRAGELDLLVVDYLQLIEGDDPRQQRQQQITDISRGLKLLAKELDIPVIVLSQLSRKCEERVDKRPVVPDLRESGAIEQDADLIIFLYRDEVYNKATLDTGAAEVIVAKQRSGPTGTIMMEFNGATTEFRDGRFVPTAVPSPARKGKSAP